MNSYLGQYVHINRFTIQRAQFEVPFILLNLCMLKVIPNCTCSNQLLWIVHVLISLYFLPLTILPSLSTFPSIRWSPSILNKSKLNLPKWKLIKLKKTKMWFYVHRTHSLGGFFSVFIHWFVDFKKKETVAVFFFLFFYSLHFIRERVKEKKSTYLFVKIYFLCTMAIYF